MSKSDVRLAERVQLLTEGMRDLLTRQQRLAESITECEIQNRFLLTLMQVKVTQPMSLLDATGKPPVTMVSAWEVYWQRGGRERTLQQLDAEYGAEVAAAQTQLTRLQEESADGDAPNPDPASATTDAPDPDDAPAPLAFPGPRPRATH